MIEINEETFRKALADAFAAGRESGIFDLEMVLLGMIPQEFETLQITNIGDIAHLCTTEGYIRLGSLV